MNQAMTSYSDCGSSWFDQSGRSGFGRSNPEGEPVTARLHQGGLSTLLDVHGAADSEGPGVKVSALVLQFCPD